jgi:hypothetical protein
MTDYMERLDRLFARMTADYRAAPTRWKTMPKGPQGQRRPADQSQLAKRIVELASEGGDDKQAENPATKRGKARADALTAERRREIARVAASRRWKKS